MYFVLSGQIYSPVSVINIVVKEKLIYTKLLLITEFAILVTCTVYIALAVIDEGATTWYLQGGRSS